MGNSEEAKRWLKQAKIDYENAQNNLEFKAYELVCFLSHQTAEKALKAILYSVGLRPYGNSLKELAEYIEKQVKLQEELNIPMECAKELDKHYIATRYPDAFIVGIPHEYYSEKNAMDCLKWSKKIIEFAEAYLKNIIEK
ncbi:MAG: HEPN domain-containing protein [Promethearchaeia archaeon]